MLASCSQENELAENIYDDKVEIELSASNDVEIQATRSDINSTSTKSFATNNIGIFCLADKVYKGDSKTKIQWTTDDKLARYIYNAKASATDLGGTTQISFDKKQYYPEEKKYGYSFYAYYPYKSNYSISSNATQCVVSYVIDGTQDIIWGYAQSKANGAYNADYARLHPSDKPKFAFNHSLAKIQFHIIGDKKSSQSDIQRLRLTELKIEVPQTVKLMAANTDVNKIIHKILRNGYIEFNRHLLRIQGVQEHRPRSHDAHSERCVQGDARQEIRQRRVFRHHREHRQGRP